MRWTKAIWWLLQENAPSGLADPPGQRQGTTFIDDMDHQCGTPAAYATAIHDEYQRLQGEMAQQDLRVGQKVYRLEDVGVVAPTAQSV